VNREMSKHLIAIIDENYNKFPDIDKCPICCLPHGIYNLLRFFFPSHAERMIDHILEHMVKEGLLKKVTREDGEIGYEMPREVVEKVRAKYTEKTGIV